MLAESRCGFLRRLRAWKKNAKRCCCPRQLGLLSPHVGIDLYASENELRERRRPSGSRPSSSPITITSSDAPRRSACTTAARRTRCGSATWSPFPTATCITSWIPRRCWPSATPSRTSRAKTRKGELIATFQDFKNFLPVQKPLHEPGRGPRRRARLGLRRGPEEMRQGRFRPGRRGAAPPLLARPLRQRGRPAPSCSASR